MNSWNKNIFRMATPGLIECLFYFVIKPKDPEMFFFICSSILTIMLIYSIIFTTTNMMPSSPVPCTYNASWGTGSKKENFSLASNTKNKILSGIKDKRNIVYLSYLVVNIIAYIIVM